VERLAWRIHGQNGCGIAYCVDKGLDILDAKAEGDNHGDAKNTVQRDAPHHRFWQLDRSVFQLFAHVCSSVGANETPDCRRQADESAQTVRAPASSIVEFGEYLFRWRMFGHHPKDDEKDKETHDVCEQNDAFGQWEVVSAPDVESHDQEGEGEHEQSDLPLSREGSVWISSRNELLDDPGQLGSTRRNSSDPTNR
jgi:hypothetical protein